VRLLTRIHGAPGLIAHLIYATGMRLGECLALRIADIDLETLHITICTATGEVDRIVPLPRGLAVDLHEQIRRVQATHRANLDAGRGHAPPNGLFPGRRNSGRSLAWQYVFPASQAATDPHTGLAWRHQLEPARVEREIAEAASRAGLSGTLDSQLLRQCFTLRMLEDGQDVETLRRLLGGEDPLRLIGRPREHDGAEGIEEAGPVYRGSCAANKPWIMP
jgi:site-specific recombinase XerD